MLLSGPRLTVWRLRLRTRWILARLSLTRLGGRGLLAAGSFLPLFWLLLLARLLTLSRLRWLLLPPALILLTLCSFVGLGWCRLLALPGRSFGLWLLARLRLLRSLALLLRALLASKLLGRIAQLLFKLFARSLSL
jgi:hypothetical protein